MILSLKKTLALGLVAALLGVMTVYGMSLFVAKKTIASVPEAVSTLQETMEFTMTLDKAQLNRNENISITLSLKNIGNTTVKYYWNYREFDFAVYDLNGTQLFRYLEQFALPLGVSIFDFTPGLQVTEAVILNPSGYFIDYWYNNRYEFYRGKPFAPGVYNIVGLSHDAQAHLMVTPPIAVVINP